MSELFRSISMHAGKTPDKLALVGSDLSLSYHQLMREVESRQAILKERGTRVLGLRLSNGPDWICWDLAALVGNIVCVPIPLFFSSSQTEFVIRAAGIDECVTEIGFETTGIKSSPPMPKGTAKITFTSGTTNEPKGVCLPGDGLECIAQSIVQAVGPDYAIKHLSVLPLAILLENIAGVYASLIAGATIMLPDASAIGMSNPFQPDFTKLLQFISSENVTSLILVPELLRGLVGATVRQPEMAKSLRFVAVGGSHVPPGLIKVGRNLGIPVYEGYGLSECGSVVTLNTPSADYDGSTGALLPHIQATIENGEVVIQNPVFLGYLGDCEGQSSPFRTGDLGRFDASGALSITGRKKNVLITSQGRNISPEWVESCFLAQPQIGQILVYGDALPFPAALIVPTVAGADIPSAVARANASLPLYAQVHDYHIVPPFTPQSGLMTGNGRLRRERILDFYKSIIAKEYDHDVLRQTG